MFAFQRCPLGWIEDEVLTTCFYNGDLIGGTWDEANVYCKMNDAGLLLIKSKEKTDRLLQLGKIMNL